jgi:hypothetical protein
MDAKENFLLRTFRVNTLGYGDRPDAGECQALVQVQRVGQLPLLGRLAWCTPRPR